MTTSPPEAEFCSPDQECLNRVNSAGSRTGRLRHFVTLALDAGTS
jgi:hypothetical protein